MGGRIYTAKDFSMVASSIAGASSTFRAMEPEHRARVALYLHEIGSTLKQVSNALRKGESLDELQGAMQIHVLMFAETVAGVVDPGLIDYLQAILGEHWVYESLESQIYDKDYPYLQGSEQDDFPEHDHLTPKLGLTEYRLGKLDEAAGMFKALATALQAQG
ncbi:hypothetical protein [Leptolyngbya sp. FACHB-17]|uniref:hypothetical protein n=1 Tax=unclassified Leptolyngbya TaxID=2650499 RepID=UPI0016815122|nr:hypothetical protein [Leptolyngbya sp. FACHB-17]MBD2079101.1 hypothetical protein [Leptolyngbya sp. FACHB-17]